MTKLIVQQPAKKAKKLPDHSMLGDDELSIARLFLMGPAMVLTFRTPSRVTPRAKAALDNLVKVKFLIDKSKDGVLHYAGTPDIRAISQVQSQKRMKEVGLCLTSD